MINYYFTFEIGPLFYTFKFDT
uniref:Uncharacterized protein n=1 Tax=Rhizophora mucronata TaxID=61149 RepID=A0A2P2PHR9_RHIMU